jgi:HAD superfamily hydrolase (TIGR01509 family)
MKYNLLAVIIIIPQLHAADPLPPHLYNFHELTRIGKINPDNAIFLFDLHHVVLKSDKKERLKQIWNLPQKGNLGYLLINPWFVRDVYRMYKDDHRCYEAYILRLTEKYPALEPYKLQLLDIGNTHDPHEEVVETLKKLKERGFKLFVFSNVGIQTYGILQKELANLFSLFIDARVCGPENEYSSKPAKRAYYDMLEMLKKHNIDRETTKIIFIDDKKSNLKPAKDLGIHALWFTSPYQLRKELRQIKAL